MRIHLRLAFFFIVGLLSASAWAFPIQVTKHGPNCWNAALVQGRVLEAIRYMSGAELHEVLRSGVCSPVPASELRGGEIRVYSLPLPELAETDRYVHANLRIDDEWSLNKMTNLLTSRIQKEREEVVRKTYGRVPEIVTLHNRDGRSFHCAGSTCETRIEYFRCSSLEDRLRESDSALYAGFREVAMQLQGFVFLPADTETSVIEALTSEISQASVRFEKNLMNRCLTSSFPCSYYGQALRSFNDQLRMNQPRREWLQDFLLQDGSSGPGRP